MYTSLMNFCESLHVHHIVTLVISCYSIYKRWHQLYTAYSGEEQLPSPLDVEGFANLEASLPNSYIMNTMDELQVIILYLSLGSVCLFFVKLVPS